MAPHATSLDHNTKIPLGLGWFLAATAVSSAVWVTTMFVNLAAAQVDIKAQHDEIANLQKDMNEIKSDIRLIGDRLGVKRERQ